MDYQRLGPYEIIATVGINAYRLKLPKKIKIHPVFHVSLLEIYHSNVIPSRIIPPPPPIMLEGIQEYEVEGIIDSRIFRNKPQYLVKWKGYSIAEATWEKKENLTHAPDALEKFHKAYLLKPGKDPGPEEAGSM